jgi:hypothetical protein
MRLLELNLTPDRKSIARFRKIDSLQFNIGFIVDDECVTALVFDNILHIGKFPVLIIVRSSAKYDVITVKFRFP